jgi:hypothetical protein
VATVRKGTKSSAQDNFIGPNNVTGVTSTNVGSGRAFNDGRIDVSWTNPSTGNTPTGYKVYDGATLKATIAHPTSTAQITGLSSNTSYTFTVKAYDAHAETAGVSASAVTATTVPATPSAPSATAQGSASTDDVSWSAPADGGSAITGYTWSSSDGKSGSTASTSVAVSQEAGTAQTYNVYATNVNGNSGTSAASGSVTSFSFTPFGFAPFGAFGFTPFGAFGFTPFGAFGFTPVGGFTCIHEDTLIRTPNGNKMAKDLVVGEEVTTVTLSELPTLGSDGDYEYTDFNSSTLTSSGLVSTTITNIQVIENKSVLWFNGDTSKKYSFTQPIFIKRGANYIIKPAALIGSGDYLIKILEDGSISETEVISINEDSSENTVYQFNCEPEDWFIAGDILVHNK